MRVLIKVVTCFVFALLVSQAAAQVQETASTGSIVDKVDENRLVKLTGNTHPAANVKNDRGCVHPAMRMTDLILVLKRSDEQQAKFDAFVASQYDATSPNYHHWLEPAEVGERFGPSLTDIGTISSWLFSHGLSIDGVSKDRMMIRFSGSAGQVQAAFRTEIHNLSVNDESHFSNMTDPQIPMALEPVVVGPKALHNFVPRPLHRLGGKAALNRQTGRWERTPGTSPLELNAFAAMGVPQPELGIEQGSGTTNAYIIEDVTPYDFATIYNVLPLWSESIDGTGQTIAVAGRSDVRSTDVTSFRVIFGLPTGAFNIIHNGSDPGYCTGTTGLCTLADQVENALDVEWAAAVAKGATIDLVVTQQTDTNDAVYESSDYVISNKIAQILNVSYGLCELGLGTSGNASYNSLWQTAAAEGIAVFVAAGDAGSPACDQGQSATTPYNARFGLSVNGLASTPFNTAVGGTDFTWCNPTASALCTSGSPYWGSTNSTATGANAQGYIAEVPWNDTCTTPAGIAYLKTVATVTGLGTVTNAESACNFIYNNYLSIYYRYRVDLSSFVYVEGTGGGASSCTSSDRSTAASCSGGYSKPGWQTGVNGIANDGKRGLPDVSFFAGAGRWNSAYLICVSDAGTCVTTISPANPPAGGEVGGTSVGTPAMAGVMALINQKAGSAQGSPNSELYQLATKQTYSNCRSEAGSTSNGCYFNDIDNGTNAMPCAAGSPNCAVSLSSNPIGVLSGYGATTGYDLATGLGTLNVANVVNAWPTSTSAAPATVIVIPGSGSIHINESLTVSVMVQGPSGTPTGSVTLSGSGYSSAAQTLSSGSTGFTVPANSLSIGTYTLTAEYSGDSAYSSASSTAVVTVSEAVKLKPTITVAPASNSIHVNESLTINIAVGGSSSTPTGNVTLSGGGYTSSSQALSSGSTIITIPANTLSIGTNTLTANYGGDSTYLAASGAASVTLTEAVKSTPTITVIPASTSMKIDQSLSVSVMVQGTSGSPTGSVTLSGGEYSSASQTLSSGTATFAIPSNSLSVGTVTLTAHYSGDSIYAVGSGTTVITVAPVKLTPTITITPASNSIARNQVLNLAVAVTGSDAMPTGTVTVTGGGYTSASTPLVAGAASFTIPANILIPGTATLLVSYGGDAVYLAGTGTVAVTVSKLMPSLTVYPNSTSIHVGQSFDVTVTVSGLAETPSGTVILSGGGYTSPDQVLSAGKFTFSLRAGALTTGSHTLAILYSGDGVYMNGSASSNVTVTPSTYVLTASVPPAMSRGGSATSTITVSSNDGYSGTVALNCTLTDSPTGASYLPTCTVASQSSVVTLSSSCLSGTARVVVTTTGVTTAQVRRGMGIWASSGTVLALLVLFVCPHRGRSWRTILSTLMMMVLVGSVGACGGSGIGGNSGSGGGGDSGTTAGVYSFTVTGTGNPAISPTPTASFSVIVN